MQNYNFRRCHQKDEFRFSLRQYYLVQVMRVCLSLCGTPKVAVNLGGFS